MLWNWGVPLPIDPAKMLGADAHAALLVVIAAPLEKHSTAASVLLPSTSTPVVMPLVWVRVALKLANDPPLAVAARAPTTNIPTRNLLYIVVCLPLFFWGTF
jgi:hypothetical protein